MYSFFKIYGILKYFQQIRNIRFCEAALVEILETLRKNLKEPEINLVKANDDEYYECLSKTQNRGQKCQDCINCYYFNFLSVFLQRNNEALIQSKKLLIHHILNNKTIKLKHQKVQNSLLIL